MCARGPAQRGGAASSTTCGVHQHPVLFRRVYDTSSLSATSALLSTVRYGGVGSAGLVLRAGAARGAHSQEAAACDCCTAFCLSVLFLSAFLT